MRLALLLGSALAVAGGWVALDRADGSAESNLYNEGTFACTVVSVTDGDTFRCEETDAAGKQIRVRLSGVAARERDNSCSPGHPCPDATAEAATDALASLALGQSLTCLPSGSTYGRIAAFCRREDGSDLSCAMVAGGTVARWDRYWKGHSC